MFKGVKKFFSDKISLSFLLGAFFFTLFFSFFYSLAVKEAQSVFKEQLQRREELAVESGVNSIEIFLDTLENSLLLLSRNPEVANLGGETQSSLDQFARDWEATSVVGAIRTNKDGDIVYISSNVSKLEVVSGDRPVTDRDYFVWAKTAKKGKTYVGKPLIPRIESSNFQYVFPFATPIYKNDEFNGVLALAISLSRLMTIYLDPLKVSPETKVYLIHTDGTILSSMSGHPELVGVNYFEYLKNKPYPGSEEALEKLRNAIEIGKGRLDVVLYSPVEEKPIRVLIAHSPVSFENAHWILSLAVPFRNVNNDFEPLRETSIVLFSLAILFIMTLSFMGIFLARSTQTKAYLKGLEEGKKRKKQNK